MSFAGHVLDMISRVKYNRNLIIERHERLRNLRKLYSDSHPYKNIPFHERELSCEQREKIKAEIRRKIKRDNIKNTTLTSLSFILAIGIIFLFIYFILNIN